ncbi:neuropeptide-like protein 32 [Anastrepha obliqua]|uniref:neuropeptide-like protein 32 n=1 Tax=Anastrepha ludens TaxID=28586 RepID=UPI0023B0AEFA|nr:neuropeptide-like protein 32 [Anastrepha ludens]XP_054747330.1 neuropeptide-like protein 32 [Anastrepha obliqua]
MRRFVIISAMLVALAFLYQTEAAPVDELPSKAALDESKAAAVANLLDVDAGGEHSSDTPRAARHYGYGWSYGWGQPWSYYSNSWGRPWGGYGWGAWGGYGGGWGRPWSYWG